MALPVVADAVIAQNSRIDDDPRYLADIQVNTANELNQLLRRAEKLLDENSFQRAKSSPVAFILHGPEARFLLIENYKSNKMLVDLAARLSAFQVVNIQVCETWMGGQGLDGSQLPPFVESVPYGPGEKEKLLEQGYIYF